MTRPWACLAVLLAAGCDYRIGGPAPTADPARPGFTANHGSHGSGTGPASALPAASRKELSRVRTGP